MGTLIIAAAPIGNSADASARLKEVIGKATLIAAEDSRKLFRLCKDIGVVHNAKVISFFEGNEKDRLEELGRALAEHAQLPPLRVKTVTEPWSALPFTSA